jgi:hypothetical protein
VQLLAALLHLEVYFSRTRPAAHFFPCNKRMADLVVSNCFLYAFSCFLNKIMDTSLASVMKVMMFLWNAPKERLSSQRVDLQFYQRKVFSTARVYL